MVTAEGAEVRAAVYLAGERAKMEANRYEALFSVHGKRFTVEKFMQEFSGPVVVISHDHRFLDNVCTHILDVDYRTVILYYGNYTKFVGGKQSERQRRERQISKRVMPTPERWASL